MKRVALLAIVLGLATARAQISFGPVGTGILTFDTVPTTNEWRTRAISGSASDISNAANLDAAVQTNSASGIVAPLLIDAAPPSAHTVSTYSVNRQALYTGPAGVTAGMLLGLVRNDSGLSRSLIQIVYDLEAVPPTPPFPAEIPGHRVYFSLSGAAYSWQFIPQLSGEPLLGQRNAVVDLGDWQPGVVLYLLWVQDNASHSPDSCYLIDNLLVGPEPPPPPCLATHPVNATAAEGDAVTLSASACSTPPYYYQWYRNGELIPGALGSRYTILRVHPADSGIYHVVLTNRHSAIASQPATVTVIPDPGPPRAELAYRADPTNALTDSIVVFFSERVDTNDAVAIHHYVLESSGLPFLIHRVFPASESSVVLEVEKLDPQLSYVLRISDVTDQSTAQHSLSPNPTTLPVQTFGPPVIPADYVWKYFDEPTNSMGEGWMNPGFDDSHWPLGPGTLGFPLDEMIPQPFVIRTVIRAPSLNGEVTTYYRAPFTIDAPLTNSALQFTAIFDEGAIVYLNGSEIWRVRLPSGPVTSETLAGSALEPHVVAGPKDVYAPGLLRPGTNWLAVELHQTSPFSGDIVMGLMMRLLEASGCRPVLTIAPLEGNHVAVNWSCEGTLQTSPAPSGPTAQWQDVLTATNRFTTNLSAGALFFRVRR